MYVMYRYVQSTVQSDLRAMSHFPSLDLFFFTYAWQVLNGATRACFFRRILSFFFFTKDKETGVSGYISGFGDLAGGAVSHRHR